MLNISDKVLTALHQLFMKMPSKRMKYTAKFKLQVVKFAQETNNCAASREFCVNEKLVRDWRKQIEKLKCMPKNKCSNRGKKCQWPQLEDKLIVWIEEQRQSGYIVTRNMIRIKALAMTDELNITGFQASNNWCSRFLARNNLALRQKTKIAQKLPGDLEEKIVDFHRFVLNSRKKGNYELVNIGNMDETPVWFDMPSARTVTTRGEKTVTISTTGHEKSRFTVVLSCLADGTKLKPMVIFKRKTQPKEKFPPGVVVHHHPKGWMDADGMKLWIQKVWSSRPGGLLRKKSLLVWDAFRAHLADPVKRALRQTNTDIVVIPGGLTSVLQPLDVCLNKPFKDRMRERWITWMVEGEKSLTPAGNVKAPSLTTVTSWVLEAWRGLPEEMVARSFKKCGISNSIDGTEDDILWEEDANPEQESDDAESEDEDLYDDQLTEEQWRSLFGESDGEDEFEGF